ncbi:hypothetical protein AVL48_06150 [Amycolatopsis regifaucium]|uniref:DUF4878 domain-containing protein n=1 Tax=Amycolatopsis regifaucium TaxID=546365 RepID=A0A154MAJ5_9PSEU|nr:hypothetical protein [Amycolatopsis regifaucium]KZB81582.1 hypothetical protein AVL48_06150 [Amycolatopsis regifaucium]OKA06847.1 hypothetical protein ATP06_0220145 [Amycolatopsis regifaucium]
MIDIPTRRTATVAAAIAVAIVWVSVITVLIAHQPDPGVGSPGQLREDLATALNQHDVEALSELIDYPPASADDFAKSYIDALAGRGAHDVTVTFAPDDVSPTSATVSGKLADGRTFGYPVAVAVKDELWMVSFTPPLP